jgi:ferritin-like protein
MSSEGTHEPYDLLSDDTKNLHRAIVSLIEELEAVDWYTQRASVCPDAELRAVLMHHRDEEVEHAMMNLEWIRRKDPVFDGHMKTYLFTTAPITAVEAAKEAQDVGAAQARPGSGGASASNGGGSLGIGSLREV